RHRGHALHPHHQRAGSRDPGCFPFLPEACLGRPGIHAAPDASAVAVLRPSRHRRSGGGSIQRVSRHAAGRFSSYRPIGVVGMSNTVEIKVPDIGDFKEVEVIELLVAEGDTIEPEQSLVTVESDKASMEIPASHGGVIRSLKVKVGDKVAEGSVLLVLETAEDKPEAAQDKPAAPGPAAPEPAAPEPAAPEGNAEPAKGRQEAAPASQQSQGKAPVQA